MSTRRPIGAEHLAVVVARAKVVVEQVLVRTLKTRDQLVLAGEVS